MSQLLMGSIGFLPLDQALKNELHVSTSIGRPPNFRSASSCPGLDHPTSGLRSVAHCEYTAALTRRFRRGEVGTCPASSTVRKATGLRPIGFPVPRRLVPFKLATTLNSQARDSRRILQFCLPWLAGSLAIAASPRVCAFKLKGRLTNMFHALFTCLTAFFSAFLQSTSALSDSGHV